MISCKAKVECWIDRGNPRNDRWHAWSIAESRACPLAQARHHRSRRQRDQRHVIVRLRQTLSLFRQHSHGSSPPSTSPWRPCRSISFSNPQTNRSPSILLLRRRDRLDRLHHLCRWSTPGYESHTGLARTQRRCNHRLDSGFVLVARESHHVCIPCAFIIRVRDR
jgi:hypothetical protein